MKILLSFFITLGIVFLYGCSDTTVTPGSSGITGHYECPIGSNSELSHYLTLNLSQSGNNLTGNIKTTDIVKIHTGSITGTNDGTNVTLNADIDSTQYDFTFIGTVSSGNNNEISGKLNFTGHPDTLLVTSSKITAGGLTASVNPYIFQTDYESPNPSGPPVVFVHGMGTTLHEWDSLIVSLDSAFKSRHNVYRYQYDWLTHIETNGIILKDSVNAKGLVNPIFIGHSMGGLVSRAYVKNGGTLVKLITLGTPNYGSPLAYLKFMDSTLAYPGPQDLEPTSIFLAELNSNPVDISQRNKYYTTAGRMGGSFSGTPPKWTWNEVYYSSFIKEGWYVMKQFYPTRDNDGLVSENSALFDNGGTNNPISVQLWVDHMDESFPVISSGMFQYILIQ